MMRRGAGKRAFGKAEGQKPRIRRFMLHPAYILEAFFDFSIVLFLPAVRLLLGDGFTKGGLLSFAVGQSVWLLLLLFAAFVKWACASFAVTAHGLFIKRGVLLRETALIPRRRIASVDLDTPVLLRLLGGLHLRVDTVAGGHKHADVTLTIGRAAARQVRAAFGVESDEAHKAQDGGGKRRAVQTTGCAIKEDCTAGTNCRQAEKDGVRRLAAHDTVCYRFGFWRIVFMALTSTNLFAEAVLFSSVISRAGKILGEEFERRVSTTLGELARILSIGIPKVASTASAFLLVVFLFGFLRVVARHLQFRICRIAPDVPDEGGTLLIKSGLLSLHEAHVSRARIGAVIVKRTVLMGALRRVCVLVSAAGYGKEKNEQPLLIPSARREEAGQMLCDLVGHPFYNTVSIKQTKDTLFWICIRDSLLLLAFPAAGITAWLLLRRFGALILLLCGVAVAVFAIKLIFDLLTFNERGLAVAEDMLVLCYARRLTLFTVNIPFNKVRLLALRRQGGGRCRLMVAIPAERRQAHKLSRLPRAPVYRLLRRCGLVGEN